MAQSKRTRVAVLFGGRSVEHEISVITALQLMQAIDPAVYDVTPVYIAPTGTWHTGTQLLERSFYAKVPGNLTSLQEVTLLPKPGVRGLTKLSDNSIIPIDVFLPAFDTVHQLIEKASTPASCLVLRRCHAGKTERGYAACFFSGIKSDT